MNQEKCKKPNFKFQTPTSNAKGITLIALIITIIVMLILVAVTISVALNGGLIGKAQEARRGTRIGMVKDMVSTDAGAKQAENEGDKITRSQLKGVLEKYFKEIPDISTMTDEELNDVKLTLKDEYGGYSDIPLIDIYGGVLGTKRQIPINEVLITNSSASTAEKKSPYVSYNGYLWRVLYDSNSDYGIQLIADISECSGDSPHIPKVTLGSSTIYMAISSYNNVFKTLNSRAENYVIKDDGIVQSARCVGCDPDFSGDPNPTPSFEITDAQWESYSRTFCEGDDGYLTDFNNLKSLDLLRGADFWMCSRMTRVWKSGTYQGPSFYIRYVNSRLENCAGERVITLCDDGKTKYCRSSTLAFRPVVLLEPGLKIASGDGTMDNPYTLEK